MNILTTIEKESKDVRDMIDKAHSISRKKDLSYDSFEIDALLTMLNGYDIDENPSLLDFYDYVRKYEDYITDYYLSDLYRNIEYYDVVSNNVLERLKRANYDYLYHERDIDSIKYEEKDLIEIISDFINGFDETFYKYFRNMVDEGRILTYPFDGDAYGISGKCFLINSLRKTYVISSEVGNTLPNIITLVHELGHTYEFRMLIDKNFETRQGIYATNLCEVSSTFFEVMFNNYLQKNNINLNEVYYIKDKYIYLMFEQFLQVYIALRSSNFMNNSYFINFDVEEFNKIVSKVRRDFNIPLVLHTPSVNINSCLSFGMSMLTSLNLYERYIEDPKSFKKEYDKILMTYGLIKDNSILRKVGVSDENVSTTSALKRELDSQRLLKRKLSIQ